MTEAWLPVVGYEGLYEVSDLGRARSPRKVLAQRLDDKGRPRVNLSAGAVRTTAHISVLVAAAFLGDKPVGFVAEHKDGNPANNRRDNLRWASQSANSRNRHRSNAASKIIGLDYIEQNVLRPWRARVTTRNRQRLTKHFKCKTEAQEWLRRVRSENFYD